MATPASLRDGLGARRVVDALRASRDPELQRTADRYDRCLTGALVSVPIDRPGAATYVPLTCDQRLCDHTLCHRHRTEGVREAYRRNLAADRYDSDVEWVETVRGLPPVVRRPGGGLGFGGVGVVEAPAVEPVRFRRRGASVPCYPRLRRDRRGRWLVDEGKRAGRVARDTEFVRFYTLTLPRQAWPSVDGSHARGAYRAAAQALRRLTRHPSWRHRCADVDAGGLARFELETGAESCSYNPHWHVVVAGGRFWPSSCQIAARRLRRSGPAPDDYATRWCQDALEPSRWCLRCAWHWATQGQAFVVDVRRAEDAEAELCKYVCKPASIPDEATVRDLVRGLRNARCFRWLGSWHGAGERRESKPRVRAQMGTLLEHEMMGGWRQYSIRARPGDFKPGVEAALQAHWPAGQTHGPWRPGEQPPRDPCCVVLDWRWARDALCTARRQRDALGRDPPAVEVEFVQAPF